MGSMYFKVYLDLVCGSWSRIRWNLLVILLFELVCCSWSHIKEHCMLLYDSYVNMFLVMNHKNLIVSVKCWNNVQIKRHIFDYFVASELEIFVR